MSTHKHGHVADDLIFLAREIESLAKLVAAESQAYLRSDNNDYQQRDQQYAQKITKETRAQLLTIVECVGRASETCELVNIDNEDDMYTLMVSNYSD